MRIQIVTDAGTIVGGSRVDPSLHGRGEPKRWHVPNLQVIEGRWVFTEIHLEAWFIAGVLPEPDYEDSLC